MMELRWIKPIYNKIDGQDYLGLRLVQERIVGHLLPGIITITPRARYYAFYSWLLVEYAQQHPAGWSFNHFVRRREQIFGLANIAHRSTVAGLAGSQKFSTHWQEHESETLLRLEVEDYLQAARRGYGLYAGVMRALGLVAEHEDDQGWEVTPKGIELADAFAQAIRETEYYRRRYKYDEAETIETAVLRQYGAVCSLDVLAKHEDQLPILECLIALDAPLTLDPRDPDSSPLGNMRGTIGIVLDMQNQVSQVVDEAFFRRHVLYGDYPDNTIYQPADELHSVLAQWQIFQIRDLFTYALYALWTYFLHWLKQRDRASFEEFVEHVDETLRDTAVAKDLNLPLKQLPISQQSLQQHLSDLLDAIGIPPGEWPSRYQAFARQSLAPLNAQALYEKLKGYQPRQSQHYLGTTWFMLISLYCRLMGLSRDSAAWYWVEEGGVRRRSLALFVEGISHRCETNVSVLETVCWLFRDHVIAQHTVASLDKWRQRKANTFHFRYEEGWFEFVRDGRADLSASRFRQAYDMLHDLDLFRFEEDQLKLTPLGQQTLQRIKESYHVQN